MTLALAAMVIALALGVTLGVMDGLERPAGLHWVAGDWPRWRCRAGILDGNAGDHAFTVAIALFPGVGAESQPLILRRWCSAFTPLAASRG